MKNLIFAVKIMTFLAVLGVMACARSEGPRIEASTTVQPPVTDPDGIPGAKIIVNGNNTRYHSVSVVDLYERGMHYKVFVSTPGGVHVINYTLDSIQYQRLINDK